MYEPPQLDYAPLPPDEPAKPGRIALGLAGAILYGVLIVPFAFAVYLFMARADSQTYAVIPGIFLVFLIWRFAAAAIHSFNGRPRRRRG